MKVLKPVRPGLPADTLQGHRDRFHEQFHRYQQAGLRACLWGGGCQGARLPSDLPRVSRSLRNFFRRASDMLYFKRLIQIPRLPEVPALLSTLGSEPLDDPGCLAGPHVGSGDGQGRLLGGWGAC